MADLETIIAHGHRLARENGCKDENLRDAVWELLVEAFGTLQTLPDRERAWLLSCERSHHPPVVVENAELAEWEQTLDALSLGEKLRVLGPMRVVPLRGAVDRMDEVLRWPAIIKTKNRRRDVKVLVYLAGGVKTARVRRIFGLKRRNVYDIRDRGLNHIVAMIGQRLNFTTGQTAQTALARRLL